MNTNSIEDLKGQVIHAFQILDRLSPSGEEDGDWEEALWQLQKVEDSLSTMSSYLGDMIYEAQSIKKSLECIGAVVKEKKTNPYHQVDFVTFQDRPCHAYA